MSFLVLLFVIIGKKINLSDRLILQESLNQDSFSTVINLLKRIFKYTIFFEILGAICLGVVFIPDFGFEKGIFYSIFHSISAFCNAGIDILGNNSFIKYGNNEIISITIILLIIIGGLGFTVWEDLATALKKWRKEKLSFKKAVRELSLHSKLVLIMTFILILTGTCFIYVFEYSNLTTIAENNIGDKILKSVFQSTTLRTAGFYTIDQNEMTTVSKLVSICYMFIGGSPGSTAGGIKNVTMLVVILLVITYMKDREKINILNKTIPESTVRRAIVVFAISIFIIIIATVSLLLSENFVKEELFTTEFAEMYTIDFMDILFEVISAFGTVGLTLGITGKLTIFGKVILIVLMIIGRLRTSNYINSFI